MSVKEIYEKIYDTLLELVNIDDSIILAILADPTGELIHFATNRGDKAADSKVRMAAATVAATFGGAELLGEDFALNKPSFLIYEFENGNLVLTRCFNKATLAIVTKKESNLGAIRLLAKKYSEKLSLLIKDLYTSMEKELKESTVLDNL